MPPKEQWAPGMGEALAKLQEEILQDGWVEIGQGAQPWEHRYRRTGAEG